MARSILLTGATGLVGRYLLRDLLASGRSVGVLIRGNTAQSADERLDALLDFARSSLGRWLPRPLLLEGDLRSPQLGLGAAERSWLAREADAVIHSAAYVAYEPTPEGEPWETNVNGTYRLFELCRSLGINEIHHLSTAFICGNRRGTAYEDELDLGDGSDNAYEQSKFAAEQMIRQFTGVETTIYRPSIVVGDSRTGYTSTYHHFYRFLELAARLSGGSVSSSGKKQRKRNLEIRLPLTGDEVQNIVPVDWVSQAILALMDRPRWHGRTYHLVARRSPRLRDVAAMTADLLQFEGVSWVGPNGLIAPTALEQLVLDQFRHYWSYLRADVRFDARNLVEALPDLPPPELDAGLVSRLLAFAQRDGWGRSSTAKDHDGSEKKEPHDRVLSGRRVSSFEANELAHYLESILPARMQVSPLGEALPPGLLFVLDVRGPNGGQWSFRCDRRSLRVWRGRAAHADVAYCLDAPALADVIHRRQTAQHAFFEGRIDIEGDAEKAMKLALLIEQFLAQDNEVSPQETEMLHAAS
jgi:thioester reductase-like protein